MLPDLLDSISRPAAYRRFAAEKAARTAAFVAFLSIVFVGAIGIAVKLRLAPMFDETFAWLETSMPTLTFANGTATSSVPGPQRLEHPKAKEVALMIDTGRQDPVTAAQMADAKVLGWLTAKALYLERGQGEIETIDLSKSGAERPTTIDASSYKELERAFDWVFYPALMLFFFATFAASVAFCALVWALVGMLLASVAGVKLGFGSLYKIGVHAQAAGSLLYALDAVMPVTIPGFQIASAVLSGAFVWLALRATAAAASAPPPPAPAA